MLRRLSVSNYILIDSLEIEFDPRLNIITGETGAGKSILLGALGLLLGNKNEGAALRDTQRNCVIEGVCAPFSRPTTWTTPTKPSCGAS